MFCDKAHGGWLPFGTLRTESQKLLARDLSGVAKYVLQQFFGRDTFNCKEGIQLPDGEGTNIMNCNPDEIAENPDARRHSTAKPKDLKPQTHSNFYFYCDRELGSQSGCVE